MSTGTTGTGTEHQGGWRVSLTRTTGTHCRHATPLFMRIGIARARCAHVCSGIDATLCRHKLTENLAAAAAMGDVGIMYR